MSTQLLEKREGAIQRSQAYILCPRCHTGQMFPHREVEGLELKCVQCAYAVNKLMLLAVKHRALKAA